MAKLRYYSPMKLVSFILLSVICCFGAPALRAAEINASSAAETVFDPVIDDLPLMNGLTAVPDEDTLFVAPHIGRIADSTATGAVGISAVYDFYRRALPHLGWKIVDSHTYRRGGEKLSINAQANGKITIVRFSIKPE